MLFCLLSIPSYTAWPQETIIESNHLHCNYQPNKSWNMRFNLSKWICFNLQQWHPLFVYSNTTRLFGCWLSAASLTHAIECILGIKKVKGQMEKNVSIGWVYWSKGFTPSWWCMRMLMMLVVQFILMLSGWSCKQAILSSCDRSDLVHMTAAASF